MVVQVKDPGKYLLTPESRFLIGMKVLSNTFILWTFYSKNIMCVSYSEFPLLPERRA